MSSKTMVQLKSYVRRAVNVPSVREIISSSRNHVLQAKQSKHPTNMQEQNIVKHKSSSNPPTHKSLLR